MAGIVKLHDGIKIVKIVKIVIVKRDLLNDLQELLYQVKFIKLKRGAQGLRDQWKTD